MYGYDEKTNCLTFPVRDKQGNCLFVVRRNVSYKMFNYPNNVEKPLYGLYELYKLREFPKEIYITESIIDCLTLWSIDMYAVALNGTGTKYQMQQLNELPCRKIILATDNDNAGKQARIKLKQNIKNKIITEVILPKRKKRYKRMCIRRITKFDGGILDVKCKIYQNNGF